MYFFFFVLFLFVFCLNKQHSSFFNYFLALACVRGQEDGLALEKGALVTRIQVQNIVVKLLMML